MVAHDDDGRLRSSSAPRIRRVHPLKCWRLCPMEREQDSQCEFTDDARNAHEPTAHKAVRIACDFEQDRLQPQIRRDRECILCSKIICYAHVGFVRTRLLDRPEFLVQWCTCQSKSSGVISRSRLHIHLPWAHNVSETARVEDHIAVRDPLE